MQISEPHVVSSHIQRIRRNTSRRFITISLGILCALLIIAIFISLFIIYFLRYRYNLSHILSYPNFICTNHPCGCPNIKSFISKIVGGEEASPYIYPWLVTLTDRHRIDPFCAGFIISSNTILTAAHCLNDRYSNQIQILSKIHDLRDFHGERHDIDHWIIHPEYRINDSMHLNDIALIKIKQEFSQDLQPCCLPKLQSNTYPKAKSEAIISGWGKILAKPTNRYSPILQHVVVPIVDHKNSKCRQSITDTHRQLCAGYDNLSIDSCSGDSGGPLIIVEYDDKNHHYGHFVAAGIVSYGNRQCDASISSGVYTRISFYHDWINKTLSTL